MSISGKDLLKREEFIDDVVEIVKVLKENKENKENTCFAIDGEWGIGKTFVLDKICEKLDEKSFEVIKYNCWEYNFYPEPIVALTSAFIAHIDDSKIITKVEMDNLKKAATVLANIGGQLLISKLGVDFNEALASVRDKNENVDQYFDLKKSMTEVRKTFVKISETKHLVIAIDEIDRCLPEYAIRVLEQMYHLFEGVTNCTIIMSTNYTQLTNTVKGIFGDNKDVCEKYMKKFISFHVKLGDGMLQDEWQNEFKDFSSLFDNSISSNEDVNEFIEMVMRGVDMREKINIIKKAELVHKLAKVELCDKAVLAFEIVYLITNGRLDASKFVDTGFQIERPFNAGFQPSISLRGGELNDLFKKEFNNRFDFQVYPRKDGLAVKELKKLDFYSLFVNLLSFAMDKTWTYKDYYNQKCDCAGFSEGKQVSTISRENEENWNTAILKNCKEIKTFMKVAEMIK